MNGIFHAKMVLEICLLYKDVSSLSFVSGKVIAELSASLTLCRREWVFGSAVKVVASGYFSCIGYIIAFCYGNIHL